MRVTRSLSKGFVARSIDEWRRISGVVVNMEGIKGASAPRILRSFDEPDTIDECKLLSDNDIGGYSIVKLDWIPSSNHTIKSPSPSHNPRPHIRFHGSISTKLPAHRPEVFRSGYAAWRTRDQLFTAFGKSVWDVDPYKYVALRVKSDGRSYLVNVQTESIVPEDLHQHRLFAKRPGEWETVLIKWNAFVRTNHGYAVEPQAEILRQKVKSIGVGLTDGVEGPFDLSIERIWATNDERDGDVAETNSHGEGYLKSKDGARIRWDT